jgi:hypothetical protein
MWSQGRGAAGREDGGRASGGWSGSSNTIKSSGSPGGTGFSRDPPFHLPSNLRGQYLSDVNKRRKLSLSSVKKMKEAERMANTQKLLAQSIESEGEEDEARGGSDLDDHKPASGKPSLEDIDGSYSPFPPVCLDDDGELILSQAEEEAQDKVVRAVSPPGAAWDSDTYYIPDLHHGAVDVFIDIAIVVNTQVVVSRG